MTEDKPHVSTLIADCAKEASAGILSYADEAGLDRLSFLVNVAAVLASSALAAQPEDQLLGASRHIQSALRLVHCLREDENEDATPHGAAVSLNTLTVKSPGG